MAALLARICLMFIVHSCVTLIEYFIVFPVVLKPIIHYPAQPASASPLIDDTRQNAWSNIPVSPPQLGLAPCHPRPCQSNSAPVGDLEDKGNTATRSSGPPWCSSRGPGAEAAGLAEGTGCPWAGTRAQAETSRGARVPQATHWLVGRTRLGGSKTPGTTPARLESGCPGPLPCLG